MIALAIAATSNTSIKTPWSPGDSGEVGGVCRGRGALAEGAVVETVTVTFVAEFATVAGFGDTTHVASEGAPLQVKLSVPDKPPSPLTLKL